MRKLLNTIYITSEDAYLRSEGETVVVEKDGSKVGQFPLHNIENIVLFSYKGASPQLMGKCAGKGIGISFYTPFGRFLCRVNNNEHGNVLLRREQYRISDDKERSLSIAKNCIIGKVYNTRWSIDRTCRDHSIRVDQERLKNTTEKLDEMIYTIRSCSDINTLRGLEGVCASAYFAVYDEMILNQKESFYFAGRNRRPPLDNVNAMLSFGYSLLLNDCVNALQGVGLDPYVGVLHTDRPGRKSLALDLMEELRPLLVDRFVLTLINNRQMNSRHFETSESGAVLFTDEGRKIFLSEWQKHKQHELEHPYLKEKVKWGLVPFVQALLLSRHIRNDIDGYPPFLWR